MLNNTNRSLRDPPWHLSIFLAAVTVSNVFASDSVAQTKAQRTCELPLTDPVGWKDTDPAWQEEWNEFGRTCFQSVPANRPHATLRLATGVGNDSHTRRVTFVLIDGALAVAKEGSFNVDLRVTPGHHCIRVRALVPPEVKHHLGPFETWLKAGDLHKILFKNESSGYLASYSGKSIWADPRTYANCLRRLRAERGMLQPKARAGSALQKSPGEEGRIYSLKDGSQVRIWLPGDGRVEMPRVQAPNVSYASEDRDWGVSPTSTPRRSEYHAPTPRTIPGARVIRTMDLKALLDADKRVLTIDVVGGKTRQTIPGSFWRPELGTGDLSPATDIYLKGWLAEVTKNDKSRPIVFLCVSSECWLSYNASLWAVKAGYRDVIWYRGGTDAWIAAGLETRAAVRQ